VIIGTASRNEPLHHQARLLVVDVGGFERHRRELCAASSPSCSRVDGPSAKHTGGGERPGEAAAALCTKRRRFDAGGSSEIAERDPWPIPRAEISGTPFCNRLPMRCSAWSRAARVSRQQSSGHRQVAAATRSNFSRVSGPPSAAAWRSARRLKRHEQPWRQDADDRPDSLSASRVAAGSSAPAYCSKIGV